ncbi:hypothetical protein WA158_003734 [Blastocystis sp. Blastoise]
MEEERVHSRHSSMHHLRTSSDVGLVEKVKLTDNLKHKTVMVMVGLPARGKSYIVKMLHRYLNWTGYNTRIFNAGDYRREQGFAGATADFFNDNNSLRNLFAALALDDLFKFLLEEDGDVGIFDATNTTRARRADILERCGHADLDVLFIESICNDKNVLNQNYEMKLKSPDYIGISRDVALRDFMKRVRQYEDMYEPLDETHDCKYSYIKLYNVGEYLKANRCNGVLASDVIFYLLNIHIKQRKIWLCIHGETDYTAQGILGGNPKLNDRGVAFSKKLYEFIHNQQVDNILIMSDTISRCVDTVRSLRQEYHVEYTRLLCELGGGDFDKMTYDDIKTKYPEEYQKRKENKLLYRYPGVGGESYKDVIERLNKIIVRIEGCRDNVLIVAHRAVIRVILAYFLDTPQSELPDIDVEMNCIYELNPNTYSTILKPPYHLDPEL